jgi:hypothetical protein
VSNIDGGFAQETSGESLAPLTDDELTALALAADPDVAIADDALSLWDLTESGPDGLLPEWYMPSPTAGRIRLRGWRRWVVLLIIASFLAIEAYGLCSTYGKVVFA